MPKTSSKRFRVAIEIFRRLEHPELDELFRTHQDSEISLRDMDAALMADAEWLCSVQGIALSQAHLLVEDFHQYHSKQ